MDAMQESEMSKMVVECPVYDFINASAMECEYSMR